MGGPKCRNVQKIAKKWSIFVHFCKKPSKFAKICQNLGFFDPGGGVPPLDPKEASRGGVPPPGGGTPPLPGGLDPPPPPKRGVFWGLKPAPEAACVSQKARFGAVLAKKHPPGGGGYPPRGGEGGVPPLFRAPGPKKGPNWPKIAKKCNF